MNTRKYPRTLNEAFGPYAGSKIEEAGMPFDKADAIVIWGCVIAAAVSVGLYLFRVIA